MMLAASLTYTWCSWLPYLTILETSKAIFPNFSFFKTTVAAGFFTVVGYVDVRGLCSLAFHKFPNTSTTIHSYTCISFHPIFQTSMAQIATLLPFTQPAKLILAPIT